MQTPTDEVLRDAVRAAIETGSLRRVARLTGLSPGCIRGFLDGARPFASTRGRLERWFMVEAALRASGPLPVLAIEGLLALLLRPLTPATRRRAVDNGVALLATARLDAAVPGGRDLPRWPEGGFGCAGVGCA